MFVKYKIPYFCVIFDRHSNYMLMFCLDDGQILIFISFLHLTIQTLNSLTFHL